MVVQLKQVPIMKHHLNSKYMYIADWWHFDNVQVLLYSVHLQTFCLQKSKISLSKFIWKHYFLIRYNNRYKTRSLKSDNQKNIEHFRAYMCKTTISSFCNNLSKKQQIHSYWLVFEYIGGETNLSVTQYICI